MRTSLAKKVNMQSKLYMNNKIGGKLGEIFEKKIVSADITGGTTTVDFGEVVKVYSAMVIASDGTLRVITKIEHLTGVLKGKIKLTVTGLANNDTIRLVI